MVKYAAHIEALWKLAGEIGTLAERGDNRYSRVYMKLSEALDEAEITGLIVNKNQETAMDEPETSPYRYEVNGESADGLCLAEECYDIEKSALKRAKELVERGADVRVWKVDANGSILRIWDNETLAHKETTDAF